MGETVLEAASDIDNFGVIVNIALDKTVKAFKEDPGILMRELGFTRLSKKPETSNLFVYPKQGYLEGRDNKVPGLPQSFQTFLDNLPEVIINPRKVQELQIDELEKKMVDFEQTLVEVRAEADQLR